MSHLTGKAVAVPRNSAVFDHAAYCNRIDVSRDFSVLATANSEFHLKIKESLLIKQDSPVLNKAVSSLPLKLF